MREIKFRAWDEVYKKFVYSDAKLSNLGTPSPASFWAMVEGGLSSGREVPVQQFTNLKDKNGTEIYEGDVVLMVHSAMDYTGKRGVIEWCDTGCCGGWRIQFVGIGNNERFAKYKDGAEVIGDTYQNPELLK